MTTNETPLTPVNPSEDVVKGALFALLAVPVGVIILALISSVGFVASIVGFIVAYLAVRLYRRGSGGFISRTGAWTVTAIVIGTLLLGIWASLAVGFAGGITHLALLGDPRFAPAFSDQFGALLKQDVLFIVLILAFGALGAYRTLGRAFAVARQPRTTEQLFGQAPTPYGADPHSSTITPTTYRNDVDGAPSGSADDKTKPPTSDV